MQQQKQEKSTLLTDFTKEINIIILATITV